MDCLLDYDGFFDLEGYGCEFFDDEWNLFLYYYQFLFDCAEGERVLDYYWNLFYDLGEYWDLNVAGNLHNSFLQVTLYKVSSFNIDFLGIFLINRLVNLNCNSVRFLTITMFLSNHRNLSN